MTPTERHLLACVTDTPESATRIFRRLHELPERKTLTARLRRERRLTAIQLERLAGCGLIVRGEGDGLGHPIPVYHKTW